MTPEEIAVARDVVASNRWRETGDEAQRTLIRLARIGLRVVDPSAGDVERAARAMFYADPSYKDSGGSERLQWEDVVLSSGPYWRSKTNAALKAIAEDR